jgi:YtxH-like protein
MTIANFASLAPQAYELLHRISGRRRSRAIGVASRAGWIGVGMAVGGGLALFLTPRSGPEMRERLGKQSKRARDYLVTNGIEPAGQASAAQPS